MKTSMLCEITMFVWPWQVMQSDWTLQYSHSNKNYSRPYIMKVLVHCILSFLLNYELYASFNILCLTFINFGFSLCNAVVAWAKFKKLQFSIAWNFFSKNIDFGLCNYVLLHYIISSFYNIQCNVLLVLELSQKWAEDVNWTFLNSLIFTDGHIATMVPLKYLMLQQCCDSENESSNTRVKNTVTIV